MKKLILAGLLAAAAIFGNVGRVARADHWHHGHHGHGHHGHWHHGHGHFGHAHFGHGHHHHAHFYGSFYSPSYLLPRYVYRPYPVYPAYPVYGAYPVYAGYAPYGYAPRYPASVYIGGPSFSFGISGFKHWQISRSERDDIGRRLCSSPNRSVVDNGAQDQRGGIVVCD